ncbi:tellurite resistance/C4-dicarboxylate transporter family protein [Sphingobacterium suaedae]|uniref:Tellurite resistance/C4-dicarboxylate transporter family protein n=1 Tax=Sphingobacterium suaedae TaxID=1686402 RepID=A0ABW5KMW1_9SPHI
MNALQQRIKVLLPAYFAMVMATGIISIACLLVGFSLLGQLLFYVNLIFATGLLGAFLYRFVVYRKELIKDFKSYQRGPGFFTLVAALCIIGNQFVLFGGYIGMAVSMLALATLFWFVIGYGFFFNITVTDDKKPLKDGINGTWLVIIVSIQGLSGLISLIWEHLDRKAEVYLFVALCLFLLGCVFYIYFMSLIIYRISFFPLNAMEFGAPYWINMGATAISTLSGSLLILHGQDIYFLHEVRPFLKGFVLLFWAAGTWWIPLLLLLGAWRHLIKKVKVPTTADGYDPTYWAMVFPLGMYVVSTWRLSEALQISFLKIVPTGFIYVALFAWAAVMIGFIRQAYRIFIQHRMPKP